MKACRQRKFIPSARTRSLRAGYARRLYIEAWITRYGRPAVKPGTPEINQTRACHPRNLTSVLPRSPP